MENFNTPNNFTGRGEKNDLIHGFNDFVQDINSQIANAASRITQRLTNASLTNNIYDQAARMSDIADEYAADFRQYAEAAERYAERAASRGNECTILVC